MAKGTRSRSTVSGRFIKGSTAKRSPATTVTERVGGKSTNGANRSAKSGRFVTKGYATRNPRTTMKDS